MRINTINLQIVRNLGNYESLRIGAEWTPDSNQTLADAMAAGMAELNATADMLTGKTAAPAAKPANDPNAQAIAQAVAEGDAEKAAKLLDKALTEKPAAEQAAPAAEQQAAEEDPQPDELDDMNAEKEGDTREMLTLAKAAKFNNVLGRIAAGVEVAKTFDHFRYDQDTLAILRAAVNGTRVTLAFGDNAFTSLVKAVEEQKDITNVCGFVQFADQNTANAWDLAVKMCNKQ